MTGASREFIEERQSIEGEIITRTRGSPFEESFITRGKLIIYAVTGVLFLEN